MRLVIQEYFDRVKFVKWLRAKENLPLHEAVEISRNLPYAFEFLSKLDAKAMQQEVAVFAISILEEEEDDKVIDCCPIFNWNINPPQEYIDAADWYNTLSDQHKQFVDEIVKWRSRPAVC